MAKYLDVAGTGRVRITSPEDLTRAIEARPVPVAPQPALTASAARLSKRNNKKSAASLSWQGQALYMYDRIPELHFASHFIARMLSRVRYFPARQDQNGKIKEILEGPPVVALNRIQDAGGGRSQLQYRYGLLQFVTGEGVLFGSRLSTEQERWKFLWKDEVRLEDDGVAVRLDADKQPAMIDVGGLLVEDRGIGYKMWTSHPRHSDEADAPVRAVLDICEELLLLTASVRSTAVSRMTNGMMIFPSEISPSPAEPVGDEDPESNPFLEDYFEHVQSAKENPGSAEAAVPFLLEAQYDYIDQVRYMATHDPQNDYLERELRKECVHRMALGLDMPPEALLGMTDANHWTAKQVMHDMWRSHGVPKSEQFADDLSEAYLRPALEQDFYDGWEEVVIGQDDSQVVISPDRTEEAFQAVGDIIISRKAAREILGFTEDMAPDEAEEEFLASLKLRQTVEVDNGQLKMPQSGPIAAQNGNADASEGPSEPTGSRVVSRQEARTASAEIQGEAKAALHRCRELAGIRLRRKCKECGGEAHDSLVASVLGPTGVEDPMKLVLGGTDGFHFMLKERGIEDAQAKSLCQMLELYAARTLFEVKQPDLPSGFMAQVERAEEVSRALSN